MARIFWLFAVLVWSLAPSLWARAAYDNQVSSPTEGDVTAGAALGLLADTPDGTAFAVNGHVDWFVDDQLSIGPLLQLGFTDDLTQVGGTAQAKYWVPAGASEAKLVFQAGFGFVHADYLSDDTSWLLPLGLGLDYTTDTGVSLTATALVNFTDLETGRGTEADVMPGFVAGVRF